MRHTRRGTGAPQPDEGALFALKQESKRNYLGDPEVVWKLLAQFYDDCYAIGGKTAIEKLTKILCGEDGKHYASVRPEWNGGGGIGQWIRDQMNGVPATGGDKSAVEYALAHLALHFADCRELYQQGIATQQEVGKRMRWFIVQWHQLLMGTPYHAPAEPRENRTTTTRA